MYKVPNLAEQAIRGNVSVFSTYVKGIERILWRLFNLFSRLVDFDRGLDREGCLSRYLFK